MKEALESIKEMTEGYIIEADREELISNIHRIATETLEKGKYTVEVEIPEATNINREGKLYQWCNPGCPMAKRSCSFRQGFDGYHPGPNCPRYKGEGI
jgi:hypothetical protein